MKRNAKTKRRAYALTRYIALLLVVALACSGVTFARYAHSDRGELAQGVAQFNASYSIESVNSVTFGNVNYWQYYSGAWLEQGTARTVRIHMTNAGDTDLQPTLHFEGPAEFWENIALQLTTADGASANDPVTPQIVFADLLRARDESTANNDHTFAYGDYINWDSAGNKTISTADSDDFGELSGDGAADMTLTMSGGIVKPAGDGASFSGSVTAAWGAGEDAWSVTFSAERRTVDYSVGFARKETNANNSLPVLYVDCTDEVDYYSIDIALPQSLFLPAAGETNGSLSLVAFMMWTNSLSPVELLRYDYTEGGAYHTFFQGLTSGTATTTPGGIVVTGYHFNYSGVAATQGGENISTTVSMVRRFGQAISWQHIASLQLGDGLFAHDMELINGNYVCTGGNPVTIAATTLAVLNGGNPELFGPATLVTVTEHTSETETTTEIQANEKSYPLVFRVLFTQASELPAV